MNKNSNDMKEQLTIISDDLNHGIITELEARKQLLILLGVSNNGVAVCDNCGKPKPYKELLAECNCGKGQMWIEQT